MTPVPFTLVPLALGSGFVLGWLLSWWLNKDNLRKIRDARIVLVKWSAWMSVTPNKLVNLENFVKDLHWALLSGKERK